MLFVWFCSDNGATQKGEKMADKQTFCWQKNHTRSANAHMQKENFIFQLAYIILNRKMEINNKKAFRYDNIKQATIQ